MTPRRCSNDGCHGWANSTGLCPPCAGRGRTGTYAPRGVFTDTARARLKRTPEQERARWKMRALARAKG